jgi:hypothetical protein
MGIGDWGLGIGDWGLGLGIPNPQSPIPNPQSPLVNKSQWSISLLLVSFLIGQVFLTKVNTGNQDKSNLKIKEGTEHCQNCYPNVIVKNIHDVQNIYSTGNEANVVTASNEGKGGFQIPNNHPIITVRKF